MARRAAKPWLEQVQAPQRGARKQAAEQSGASEFQVIVADPFATSINRRDERKLHGAAPSADHGA